MNAAIHLQRLSTGYRAGRNTFTIGTNINATLNRGELTCLLGPNGSGKSTLLRTLCAFLAPLDGTVEVNGQNILSYDNEALALMISVVLTDNSRMGDMTVWDVVATGRSPYTNLWGRLTDKDLKTVDDCMHMVGIAEFSQRKMRTLSDGERQKVMIAKAIAQDTDIILLDEPTAFLDYANKVGMLLLLHRIAKRLNKAVLLSTHDMEHALQIADHVWLIDKRLGLTTGSPQQLSQDGSIERYFASPDMTYDRATRSFRIHAE